MKFNFARQKTAVAVAAALSVGAAAPVFAVSHSDTGLGEVALVPYYTVRDSYDTNISVVNTSNRYVVAFKIRFREGSNSRDARDFNVFLSPNDVWTATVSMGEDGVPFIQTADTSCTAPWIANNRDQGFVVVGQTADGRDIKQLDMTNIAYAGGSVFPPDSGSSSIERAQEGHIEIIEMGVASPNPNDSELGSLAVHGPTHNCAYLAGVYDPVRNPITVMGSGPMQCNDTGVPIGSTASGDLAFQAEFCEPLNVLKVSASLIKVDEGVAGGMPVTMLSNFFNPAGIEDPNNPDMQDLMNEPMSVNPNLRAAFPAISVQVANGLPVLADFTMGSPRDGANAVSSLFSATDVINEYAVGGAADAQTAWVVTFPTKHVYVDLGEDPSAPIAPFQAPYSSGVSCVTVNFDYYDREEQSPSVAPGQVLPSPPPVTPIPTNSICDEAQVINFGSRDIFGSQHNYVVDREDGFDSGWMRLGFPGAGQITDVNGLIFRGLPTIGFSLKTLDNGTIGNALRTYGMTAEHAYQRTIE
ncbi:MAG: hypothetical protein VBE63_00160 [Lamprobacter sp.]|uniref:hypothetical protein n=1 Tax=Lamprobacter sp. TaxID=3100796 RepID=UPI002B25E859|nr:hypothetical protein [Lamprobacter sp.]MEA3638339.1 hypothetical protein [Lamprobacter sp.]